MGSLKDLIKPPFANYDVVVYFGGGLFLIPFLNRYLFEPLDLQWPSFSISMRQEFAGSAVALLAMLFSIYIVGHLLAYLGSQIIEKLMDRVLGKISTVIILSAWVSGKRRNEYIRALIYDRIHHIREDNAVFVTLIRAIFHLPFIVMYILVYAIGIFGYYNTRVPMSVIRKVRKNINALGLDDVTVSIRSKWFKPLEYFVINRSASATSRMYNYLVISGLFRSMAVIFMFSSWMQLYYISHFALDGDWYISEFAGANFKFSGISELVLTQFAFIFSIFAYLKFQRRYAEEAIFAFVFDKSMTA